MDRIVLIALRGAVSARETLEAALRSTPHDRGLPATLAAVHESGIFTAAELGGLVGLSRSRLYELLAEAAT